MVDENKYSDEQAASIGIKKILVVFVWMVARFCNSSPLIKLIYLTLEIWLTILSVPRSRTLLMEILIIVYHIKFIMKFGIMEKTSHQYFLKEVYLTSANE